MDGVLARQHRREGGVVRPRRDDEEPARHPGVDIVAGIEADQIEAGPLRGVLQAVGREIEDRVVVDLLQVAHRADERPARLQHAGDLRERGVRVADVLEDLERVDDIEGPVPVRQAAAVVEVDPRVGARAVPHLGGHPVDMVHAAPVVAETLDHAAQVGRSAPEIEEGAAVRVMEVGQDGFRGADPGRLLVDIGPDLPVERPVEDQVPAVLQDVPHQPHEARVDRGIVSPSVRVRPGAARARDRQPRQAGPGAGAGPAVRDRPDVDGDAAGAPDLGAVELAEDAGGDEEEHPVETARRERRHDLPVAVGPVRPLHGRPGQQVPVALLAGDVMVLHLLEAERLPQQARQGALAGDQPDPPLAPHQVVEQAAGVQVDVDQLAAGGRPEFPRRPQGVGEGGDAGDAGDAVLVLQPARIGQPDDVGLGQDLGDARGLRQPGIRVRIDRIGEPHPGAVAAVLGVQGGKPRLVLGPERDEGPFPVPGADQAEAPALPQRAGDPLGHPVDREMRGRPLHRAGEAERPLARKFFLVEAELAQDPSLPPERPLVPDPVEMRIGLRVPSRDVQHPGRHEVGPLLAGPVPQEPAQELQASPVVALVQEHGRLLVAGRDVGRRDRRRPVEERQAFVAQSAVPGEDAEMHQFDRRQLRMQCAAGKLSQFIRFAAQALGTMHKRIVSVHVVIDSRATGWRTLFAERQAEASGALFDEADTGSSQTMQHIKN